MNCPTEVDIQLTVDELAMQYAPLLAAELDDELKAAEDLKVHGHFTYLADRCSYFLKKNEIALEYSQTPDVFLRQKDLEVHRAEALFNLTQYKDENTDRVAYLTLIGVVRMVDIVECQLLNCVYVSPEQAQYADTLMERTKSLRTETVLRQKESPFCNNDKKGIDYIIQ